MANIKIYETKGDEWAGAGLSKDYEAMSTATCPPAYDAIVAAGNSIWPFSQAISILDNGCGQGNVTKRLLSTHGADLPADSTILCTDFAESMLAAMEAHKAQGGRDWERVSTSVQDCLNLKDVEGGSQSHVLAGFVYFMTPDPVQCLREARRVLLPGGAAVASSWQGNQWLDVMLLVKRIRPDKTMPALPEAWKTVEGAEAEFEKAGFRDVEASEVQAEMRFERAEELVELFLTKFPHVVAMLRDVSVDEADRLRKVMVEEIGKMSEGEGHPGVLRGFSIVGWGKKEQGLVDVGK